jgi:tetratricopeptide (TPR) repeat protein
LYKVQGRLAEAVEDFARAIEMNPKNPASHGFMGECLMFQKEFERAEVELRYALEHGKENSNADSRRSQRALGNLYCFQGKYEAAEKQYLELMQDEDWDFMTGRDYLHFLEIQGRMEEAQKLLQEIEARYPSQQEYIYEKQLALACNSKDVKLALSLFQQLGKANQLTPERCARIGRLCMETKRYAEAEKAYLKGCELDEEKIHNYYSELAEAAERQFGGKARVKRYLDSFWERVPDPKTPEELVDSARAERVSGNLKKSKEYLKQALECELCENCMQRGCSDAYEELGHLYEDMGRLEEALLAYEKALELGSYDYWLQERIKRIKK